MMSDPTTIDITAFDENTGKLLIVMTEDRPWSIALHEDFCKRPANRVLD